MAHSDPFSTTQHVKLSKYLVMSAGFCEPGHDHPQRLLFSTRSTQIRKVSEALWQCLSAGHYSKIPAAILSDLGRSKVIVPAQTDERAEILSENNDAIDNPDVAYHVVQPSAFCQLGCNYCGQDHAKKQLDAGHQVRLLDRIDKNLDTHSYHTLQIGWFGAEPLAGLRTMRSLSPKLIAMAQARGLNYGARIITNGLKLDLKTARELCEVHKVTSAEVTLDGPARHHDARRFLKVGGPSFERIFENIVAICNAPDIPLQLTVRCNVDGHNADGVEELIDLLADAGLAGRVNLYFAPIHDWGNDAASQGLSREDYARRELEWAVYAMACGFDQGLIPGRKKVVCVAVRPDSETIDAYGNVFNCTETPLVGAYGTPNRHQIGTLNTEETNRDINRFGNFNQDVSRDQYGCSSCPMLPVCGGACPKSWVEGVAACPPFKINMPSRILLQYSKEKILRDDAAVLATENLQREKSNA